MRAARMRTVSATSHGAHASRQSSAGSTSSSAATLRARCGRPGGGGVLAAAALVLCICVVALCAGDPDLGLRAIRIGHKLVVLGLLTLRTAVARAVCHFAPPGLAALPAAVAWTVSCIAPRRLSDTVLLILLYLTLSFRTVDQG